jgi:hypothetical protein
LTGPRVWLAPELWLALGFWLDRPLHRRFAGVVPTAGYFTPGDILRILGPRGAAAMVA